MIRTFEFGIKVTENKENVTVNGSAIGIGDTLLYTVGWDVDASGKSGPGGAMKYENNSIQSGGSLFFGSVNIAENTGVKKFEVKNDKHEDKWKTEAAFSNFGAPGVQITADAGAIDSKAYTPDKIKIEFKSNPSNYNFLSTNTLVQATTDMKGVMFDNLSANTFELKWKGGHGVDDVKIFGAVTSISEVGGGGTGGDTGGGTGGGSGGAASIVVDGVYDSSSDTYGNSKEIVWFPGHKSDESIYNDNPKTTIRYEEDSANERFFLYVEVPLYAKNMVWENLDWKKDLSLSNANSSTGLTEADIASYRIHHETHHKPGEMKLDFGGATGSEKMELVDRNGKVIFTADLTGDADNKFGLVQDGFKDSVDYLFDKGLATEGLSLNRNTKMSFEFEFAGPEYGELLDYIEDPDGGVGVVFHLSPERGLPAPEPATMSLLLLGGLTVLKRRRRG